MQLLLEGSDLESLLSRAHAQAGPGARIVRANKVRQGGVLGFFARNGFEVAVEVPDGNPSAPAAEPPAKRAKADRKAAKAAGRKGRDAQPDDQSPDGHPAAGLDAYQSADAGQLWAGGPAEALIGMLDAAAAQGRPSFAPADHWDGPPLTGAPASFQPAAYAEVHEPPLQDENTEVVLEAVRRALAHQDADDVRRRAEAEAAVSRVASRAGRHGIEFPPPGQLEAEGLLSLVERVEVAERAAARVTALGEAGRAYGSTGAATVVTAAANGGSSHATTALLERLVQDQPLPRSQEPAGLHWAVPATPGAHDDLPVPGGAANPSIRPSTAGPAFTALLDQLRHETSDRPAQPVADLPAPAWTARGGPVPAVPLALAPAGPRAFAPAPAIPLPPDPEPHGRHVAQSPVDRDQANSLLSADRRALRALGVPSGWTRRMRDGDRFGAVLRMLDQLPALELDSYTPLVAVVGAPEVVRLEAGRTAVDLPVGDQPRQVLTVGRDGLSDLAGIVAAAQLQPLVVAVEAGIDDDVDAVRATLQRLGAGIVIAVVHAGVPVERTEAWIDGLGGVDVLAVEGAAEVAAPAAVLQLELPVVRLDGIPVDRLGWAALLCARLAGPVDDDETGGAE